MIKFILTMVLSLVGVSVFAEDNKGPENAPGSAAYCQNFKDGKCPDAEGTNSNCCITHAIGTGNGTTASQLSDKTTPGEGASSGGDTVAPTSSDPKAK